MIAVTTWQERKKRASQWRARELHPTPILCDSTHSTLRLAQKFLIFSRRSSDISTRDFLKNLNPNFVCLKGSEEVVLSPNACRSDSKAVSG